MNTNRWMYFLVATVALLFALLLIFAVGVRAQQPEYDYVCLLYTSRCV